MILDKLDNHSCSLLCNLLDDDSVLGHHIREILELEEVDRQHLGLAVVLQLQHTLLFYLGGMSMM